MNSKIRVMCAFMCIVMLFSICAFSAHAAVDPRLPYISSASASLRISGTTATIICSMTGTDFTVRSTISAKLQKREAYSNDSWTTVTTYSAIGVASCSLNKTKTIESGYEYRVVGTFTGMSSSGTTETQTKYSAILP